MQEQCTTPTFDKGADTGGSAQNDAGRTSFSLSLSSVSPLVQPAERCVSCCRCVVVMPQMYVPQGDAALDYPPQARGWNAFVLTDYTMSNPTTIQLFHWDVRHPSAGTAVTAERFPAVGVRCAVDPSSLVPAPPCLPLV